MAVLLSADTVALRGRPDLPHSLDLSHRPDLPQPGRSHRGHLPRRAAVVALLLAGLGVAASLALAPPPDAFATSAWPSLVPLLAALLGLAGGTLALVGAPRQQAAVATEASAGGGAAARPARPAGRGA